MNNKSKNPFLQSNKLAVVEIKETYYETRTSTIDSSGHISKFKKIEESYFIEQQSKVNVYKTSFATNVLFNVVKSHGRDIYIYIIHNLKENEDIIDINPTKLCTVLNISRTSIYNGIQQLIDISLLCKKFKSEYWVNPLYIFRGDRLKFYQSNCDNCTEIVAIVHKDANGIKSSTKSKKNNNDNTET